MIRTFLTIMALLLSFNIFAQTTTYRWTDPATGMTVFSDHPPPPGMKDVKEDARAFSSEPVMPYATRRAAEMHPVTLVTSKNCEVCCVRGRALLKKRAIPYSDKAIETQEEYEATKKELGTEVSIPTLRVGRQSISGFNEASWNSLLDLAGYPNNAARITPPAE